MLAQFNLDSTYKQSETNNYVGFANNNGWEYTPGPKEIDIQKYDGNAKTYVNNYVAYLQGETGDSTITGNLITLTELQELGCSIPNDYYSSAGRCNMSEHAEWLVNGQDWWTRSAFPGNSDGVWYVISLSGLSYEEYFDNYGVRPVITISKSTI